MSPSDRPLRLAIAGLGTVGTGVIRLIERHGPDLATRAGRPLEVVAVSARSRTRARGIDISALGWEDDPVRLATREDVDCVIEVIGGSDGPAKALVEAALEAGKPVVTANKALIAHHGQALAERAEAHGTHLGCEAGVAGAIPVLRALGQGLAGGSVTRIFGVLNGTCNYILTRMAATGDDYASVLAEAQRLGYAEADPAFDVEGTDAAHKLAILAAMAFGTRIDFDGVITEGIARITAEDIQTAAEMGYTIKLLGLAQRHDGGLEQRVRPCMVAKDTAIGALPGVTNAVVIEGDTAGTHTLTGPGAGEGPTAAAVIADVLDVARRRSDPLFARPAAALAPAARLAHGAEHAPYYLRFGLSDRPGALAALAAALGEAGVSIARMRQNGTQDGEGAPVPVVIVTHNTQRDAIDTALTRIAALPVSTAEPVAIRIEQV
ncbi:MAG: homoserine dehydrogenase [Pseudomonadota bacterium]